MKRTDLTSAVREQLVTSHRPAFDLINILGCLFLTVDLSTLLVSEFAKMITEVLAKPSEYYDRRALVAEVLATG